VTCASYVDAIVTEVCGGDSLLVLGRGLGLVESVLARFVERACGGGDLVLVLNGRESDVRSVQRTLLARNVQRSLRFVGASDVSPVERARLYRGGGVLWITARTVVLDMLSGHLPAQLVAGIVVLRCEQVRDTSTDVFAVRECRRQNGSAFVKAFTDSPERLSCGFDFVPRTMKLLRVRQLLLWPRFRDQVKDELQARPPECIVDSQPMTESMRLIQGHLVKIIEECVNEVKRANLQLQDVREHFRLETVLTRQFEHFVAQSITPKWYSIGAQTKKLIADIRALRRLLFALMQADAVQFYRYWQLIGEQESPWIFTDHARELEQLARDRVLVAPSTFDVARDPVPHGDADGAAGESASKRARTSEQPTPGAAATVQLILEAPPKWQWLEKVLEEIGDADRQGGAGSSTTLVVAADERAANQINDFLTKGARATLRDSFAIYQRYRRARAAQAAQPSAAKVGQFERYRRAQSGKHNFQHAEAAAAQAIGDSAGGDDSDDNNNDDGDDGDDDDNNHGGAVDLLTRADQMPDWLSSQAPVACDVGADAVAQEDSVSISELEQEASFEANFGVLNAPLVLVSSVANPEALYDYRPRYVVLMQPDCAYVRELERFKAARPGVALRVYYCVYSDSVEKAHNELVLKAEEDAFRALIATKARLVLPESFEDAEAVAVDGELPANPFSLSEPKTVSKASSLIGGGAKSMLASADLVIVDTREFRSSLPSMLHRDRLRLLPATLAVGDYVLSPDLCIERKSVADLIGSLNSGHLYEQASVMCRLYERPVLLIEFADDEAFGLAPPELLQAEISGANVQSKLTLLTLHFPRLCVMLSRSSHDTARIFRQLKRGRADPDMRAVATAAEEAAVANETEDFVRALPGMTSRGYERVVASCKTISELFSKSRLQLEALLGAPNGAQLHDFVHRRQQITRKIE
jgi:DNA excision repair protein ERCC-4